MGLIPKGGYGVHELYAVTINTGTSDPQTQTLEYSWQEKRYQNKYNDQKHLVQSIPNVKYKIQLPKLLIKGT